LFFIDRSGMDLRHLRPYLTPGPSPEGEGRKRERGKMGWPRPYLSSDSFDFRRMRACAFNWQTLDSVMFKTSPISFIVISS